jgi:hypothetical protein
MSAERPCMWGGCNGTGPSGGRCNRCGSSLSEPRSLGSLPTTPCKKCKGHGFVWVRNVSSRCPDCKGRGVVEVIP